MAEEKVALENDRIANTGAPFGGPGPGMSNRGNEQYNNEYEGVPYPQGNYRGNNFSQGNYRGNYQGYPQDNYRGNYQGQGYPQGNFRGSYQSQGYPQDNFRGDYQSQGYPQDNFRGDYQGQVYPRGNFRGNYQGQVYPRGSYRSGYLPFRGRSTVGNYPFGTRYGYPYRDYKDSYDHDDDYYHDYEFDYDYDDYHYYQKYVPLGYGPYGQPYGGYGPMKQRPFGSLRNWISYNPVTNWARSPRGNNFLRGLGIATAGIILAPAIIRTIRPLAVQAVHGAMSIVGEMKGVVSDAREELEDIFADAKWENMNSREEKLQEG